MKSRSFFYCLIFCYLFLITAVSLKAQNSLSVNVNEVNISVSFLTKRVHPNSNLSKVTDNSQNVMVLNENKAFSRIIFDRESKLYFGYDLEVKVDSLTKKMIVAIKPLSTKPYNIKNLKDLSINSLSKYPEPIEAELGDMIILDILENPRTKEKLIDTIKISKRKKNRSFPTPSEGLLANNHKFMRLINVKIFLNGKELDKIGSLIGPLMYFYIPNKGRFIFSIFPQKGYDFKKAGKLEGNKIFIKMNGDSYKLVSESPILDEKDNWDIWVLHDPHFRPDKKFVAFSPYWMGVGGRVEDFFGKKKN